jgi:hypothetical protein
MKGYLLRSESIRYPCQLDTLRTVCAAVVESLGPSVAVLDGFTDCRSLPPAAQAAHDRLRALADARWVPPARRRRWPRWIRPRTPTYMDVRLDLVDPDQRSIFLGFGPWSICADVFRADDDAPALLELEDTGAAVILTMTADERSRLLDAFARAGLTDLHLLAGADVDPGPDPDAWRRR